MMTNKKSLKRALILNVLSTLLCVSMLLGTTFAWFTDTVESGVNQIVAGNLDVELKHKSASVTEETVTNATKLFKDVEKWEPGAVAYEVFTVSNEGDLALKYALSLVTANATTSAKDPTKTLADVLKVAVVDGDITSTATTREAIIAAAGTFAKLTNFTKAGKIEAGDSADTYTVVIYWEPGENDNLFNMNNEYNSADNQLKIDVGVRLVATQYTSESDSFDETYDTNADGTNSYTSTEFVPLSTTAATDVTATNVDGVAEITVTVPAEVTNVTESTSAAVVAETRSETTGADTVTVNYANVDLIDQDGKVIDLEQINNNVDIPVKVFVGKNLGTSADITITLDAGQANEQVFKTTNNTATYDDDDGYVTFNVKHFCPMKIEFEKPEAKIGDTYYAKLTEAINAAEAGATVELLKDVELSSQIEIKESITVDGKNKTVAVPNSAISRAFNVAEVANKTIKFVDITISAPYSERGISLYDAQNINLEIDRSNITAGYYAVNFASKTTIDVTIKDSTIKGWAALNIWSDGVAINVTNSVLEGVNDKGYDANGWNNFSTICFEGDTTHQTTLHSSNMNLTCTGTKIIARSTTGNRQDAVGFNSDCLNNKATFVGCTFEYGNTELNSLFYDHGMNNSLVVDGTENIV